MLTTTGMSLKSDPSPVEPEDETKDIADMLSAAFERL